MTSTTAVQIPGYVVGTWDIDAAHSTVGFSVRHMMVSKVRGLPAGEGYDALKGEYGDLFQRGIVDAAKVTRSALQNAASIAAMVLTTETLVTDIPEKEKAGAGAGHDHGGGMDF